jgi:hypothetical protein
LTQRREQVLSAVKVHRLVDRFYRTGEFHVRPPI